MELVHFRAVTVFLIVTPFPYLCTSVELMTGHILPATYVTLVTKLQLLIFEYLEYESAKHLKNVPH